MCDPVMGPSPMRSGDCFRSSFLHPFLVMFLDNYSKKVYLLGYLFVLEEKVNIIFQAK